MLERNGTRIQLALIAVMVAAGLWAWNQLPAGATVPVHFNAAGEADGWMSAGIGLSLMPLIALALLGLRWLLPRIDPRGQNIERSGAAVDTIWVVVALMLTVLQLRIAMLALGFGQPAPQLPLLLTGGMFIVMGNVLGKLRPNHSVGIRTRWTLDNERVWDQTHRFGGKAFVLAGVLLLALAATPLASGWVAPAIVAVSVCVALASVFKSYWLWRQLQQS
ncbi:SdpI family protein [Roseateles sp. LYH14W]|uniref:SdpI family protein n=1 Tax=Pelomonas parva TaxID=3299032 RepID=A0ABW7EXX0_9BURK